MDNEIIPEQNWLRRNWKWLIPLCIMALIFLAIMATAGGNLSDISKAYSDPALCQNAIDKANENQEVIEALGQLEPVDKLAIVEGNAQYSNHDNSVAISVRVTGSKGKAKMDITADKKDGIWNYKNIKIRLKGFGKVIQIYQEN